MLSYEQIVELANLVADKRLSGLEIERSGFRLQISGRPSVTTEATSSAMAPAGRSVASEGPTSVAEVAPPPTPPPTPEATAESEAHVLTSPIVGTFYSAPSPDAAPFVRVGDQVEKGQVVCIVEAMKLMNEIESDVDGVILKVVTQNAQPVEYGEPLFLIQE